MIDWNALIEQQKSTEYHENNQKVGHCPTILRLAQKVGQT